MGITDLFSKRQRRARGEVPDVFQYETLPQGLRVQIVYIFRDLFTDSGGYYTKTEDAFQSMHQILCREYGEVALVPKEHPAQKYGGTWEGCMAAFLLSTPTDRVLDFIEV